MGFMKKLLNNAEQHLGWWKFAWIILSIWIILQIINLANGQNRMLDKSLLLRQMRKHAQTFSSAVKPVKEPDVADVKRALSLIEMAEKDSKLVAFRKMSFKTPSLLKGMFLQDNLTGLRSEIEKRLSESKYLNLYKTQGKLPDELEKIKRAEQKLKKVLDTKNC